MWTEEQTDGFDITILRSASVSDKEFKREKLKSLQRRVRSTIHSGVNASLTLGGRPSPSLLPFSLPSRPSPPLPTLPLPSFPTSPLRSRIPWALLAPPAGSGAEPQPKSNLVHFSLKIRHLVTIFLMILVKSQLTEKQVVYIVKTIFTIMEVSLLSPGNINI